MKTTICTGKNARFVVAPVPEGVTVRRELRSLSVPDGWDLISIVTLTPDQAGALIFGIEQALEVGDVRAAVVCPSANCCAQAGLCDSGCMRGLKVAPERPAVACPHAQICDQEGECVNGCTQRLGASV